MLSEIFQKPKPILGTVQLLPLPGSSGWSGRPDPGVARAEQEATALASGGVDGILLENSYDTPHLLDRIDPAGAIAMALMARRIMQFTSVPLGVSVLGNDPETAFAIAINVGAPFIRVPVLVGSVITDTGLAEGRLQNLVAYKNLLKPVSPPKLMVDISLNHFVPGRIQSLIGSPQKGFVPSDFLIAHLKQVASSIEKYDLAHALILSGREINPAILEALKGSVQLPIFVEDPAAEDLEIIYNLADGLLLTHSIKKHPIPGLDPRTSVDMVKVEELVAQLRQPSGVSGISY
jgi:predicted TIM-barrel enzyme